MTIKTLMGMSSYFLSTLPIHTMDSVILKDGSIDEVCERVYGEKR